MAVKKNLLSFKPSAWDLVSISKNQSYGRVSKDPLRLYVCKFHVDNLFAVKALGFFFSH